jgi:hypothetical protein
MVNQTLPDVVLRRDGATPADSGELTIREDHLVFAGQRERLTLEGIRFISYARPSRLTPGTWVKVEYGDNDTSAVIYLKEGKRSAGASPVFDALRRFPNSGQFGCFVWVEKQGRRRRSSRRWITSAPRKPRLFSSVTTTLRRAVVATTPDRTTMTLSAAGVNDQAPLSKLVGHTRETLTLGRQLAYLALDSLVVMAALGLLGALAGAFIQEGTFGETRMESIAIAGLAMAGVGLLLSLLGWLRNLPRLRTYEVFGLSFGVVVWDLAVPPRQADRVASILKAYDATSDRRITSDE